MLPGNAQEATNIASVNDVAFESMPVGLRMRCLNPVGKARTTNANIQYHECPSSANSGLITSS